MSVEHFPDGIKIGPDATGNERLPLYDFDEYISNETVSLGTMSAGEIRTLVFENIPTVRFASKCFASPQNPNYFENLTIKHAWSPDNGVINVIVKNDANTSVAYTHSEQWLLSYWSTSAP